MCSATLVPREHSAQVAIQQGWHQEPISRPLRVHHHPLPRRWLLFRVLTPHVAFAYFRISQKERPSLPSSAFCREVHPNCCVWLSCSFLFLCEDNTTHLFIQCPRRRGCLSVWDDHKQRHCEHSCEFSPARMYTVLQMCVCVCTLIFILTFMLRLYVFPVVGRAQVWSLSVLHVLTCLAEIPSTPPPTPVVCNDIELCF